MVVLTHFVQPNFYVLHNILLLLLVLAEHFPIHLINHGKSLLKLDKAQNTKGRTLFDPGSTQGQSILSRSSSLPIFEVSLFEFIITFIIISLYLIDSLIIFISPPKISNFFISYVHLTCFRHKLFRLHNHSHLSPRLLLTLFRLVQILVDWVCVFIVQLKSVLCFAIWFVFFLLLQFHAFLHDCSVREKDINNAEAQKDDMNCNEPLFHSIKFKIVYDQMNNKVACCHPKQCIIKQVHYLTVHIRRYCFWCLITTTKQIFLDKEVEEQAQKRDENDRRQGWKKENSEPEGLENIRVFVLDLDFRRLVDKVCLKLGVLQDIFLGKVPEGKFGNFKPVYEEINQVGHNSVDSHNLKNIICNK